MTVSSTVYKKDLLIFIFFTATNNNIVVVIIMINAFLNLLTVSMTKIKPYSFLFTVTISNVFMIPSPLY